MYKIYLVSGYNSWNNQFTCKVFKKKYDAENLKIGLTNGNIKLIVEENTIDAINSCIALSNELKG